MKVLGIDPGTAACGYGIVHESEGRLRAVDHGWWQTPARQRQELRLKMIFERVAGLIELHGPDAVVIEESHVGADVRIALFVGQARGAVFVACALAASSALSRHLPASSRPSAARAARRRTRCSGW